MAFLDNFFGRLFVSKARPKRHMRAYQDVGAMMGAGSPRFDRASAPAETFPSFRASAIDRPTRHGRASKFLQARLLLRDVFTPAQPVTERARFAGRLGVLAKVIEIIEEQRSHLVIYGERGIGKTSLVHILADIARDSRYHVVYASCGAYTRFDNTFRAVLSEIPQLYLQNVSPTGPEAESGATLADKLPDGEFDARELGDICTQITGTRVLVILDEYDRITDPLFRQSVAELIKNLSDRAARVQLILTGVASNLQELIGYIPSIRRNVIGLPMPRLAEPEVRALIAIGEDAANVTFDEQAVRMIVLLSNGSPYLVRLLCHHASMMALDEERMTVELVDIWAGLDKIVDEAESRTAPRNAEIVQHLFEQDRRLCLGAAARAASTPDGWFSSGQVMRNMPAGTATDGCIAELRKLSVSDGLLEMAEGSDGLRFRFRDEALPTYVWMMIARDHFRDGGDRDAALFQEAQRA